MCMKRKEVLLKLVRQRPVPPPSHAPPDPLRNNNRPNNIYEKSARVCIYYYYVHVNNFFEFDPKSLTLKCIFMEFDDCTKTIFMFIL